MILSRITTDNFRNLASAEIAFHPRVNLVVGRNGHGKTNLLEAIYFLATTKSFRTSRVASLVRHGSPSVFVSGVLQRDVEKTLSVGLDENKRVLLINGERVPLASYVSAMTVFAYSSARLEILRGSPAELRARASLAGPQRDLLDFTIDGRAVAEVLSGGEMKMIVLFLKFAKLELFRRRFEEPAIFLLDDVDAELDLEILENLLAKMPSETQVFATSAKPRFLQVLEAAPHRRLTIENGLVTSVEDL